MMNKQSKSNQAVAIKYDGNNTPTITAKGENEIADAIKEIAEEYGVYLHEDPILAQILYALDLGDEIPNSLYVAVAEIIAFTYMLHDKVPDDWDEK